MKILYASERPPYPFFLGGAARCAHELLFRLNQRHDAECSAVGAASFSHPPWRYPDSGHFESLGIEEIREEQGRRVLDCGYPIQLLDDFDEGLGEFMADFRPDVVWTQMEGAEHVAAKARQKKIPCIYFVHDAELPSKELKALARLGCGFVASSRFLAQKAGAVLRQKVPVVYPCPRLDFGVTGATSGYVTMINPHRVKGVETFFKIARALPKVRFLLLESWKLKDTDLHSLRKALEELPNVEFRHRVENMAEIYRETRLLLVPSVWEEGFGMVAVEAQSCGIPVIASNRGGLPEAVGKGGILIDEYLNQKAWTDAIDGVMVTPSTFVRLRELAKENAASEKFICDFSADRIANVMEKLVREGSFFASLFSRIQVSWKELFK